MILDRSPSRLDVIIPPKGLTMDTGFTGAFAVAWNAFVAVWTVSALASGEGAAQTAHTSVRQLLMKRGEECVGLKAGMKQRANEGNRYALSLLDGVGRGA